MEKRFLSIREVMDACGVDEIFIMRLEQEKVIESRSVRRKRLYALDQVERIRVARVLIREMRVNLEGVDVVLHMRDQMIAMQRQFRQVIGILREEAKKGC